MTTVTECSLPCPLPAVNCDPGSFSGITGKPYDSITLTMFSALMKSMIVFCGIYVMFCLLGLLLNNLFLRIPKHKQLGILSKQKQKHTVAL